MVSRRRRADALVTGDAGFLGRHFWRALVDRGYAAYGLDTARGAHEDLRRMLPELEGDRWELVVHCAAVGAHRSAIDGCPLCVAENLELDARLFRWAARARPRRLLYLSSSAVYPLHLQFHPSMMARLAESRALPPDYQVVAQLAEGLADPLDYCGAPDEVYGWAKLVGEALAFRARAAGVEVTVVRPFSGYGSDQPDRMPFGAFVDRALALEDPFEVWGDGRQVRDWVHVDDLVAIALAAVEAGLTGPLNICTGRGVSMDALARMVTSAAGYNPRLEHRRDQPQGVAYRVGSPAAMTRFWPQPLVALEDGVRRALAERPQLGFPEGPFGVGDRV